MIKQNQTVARILPSRPWLPFTLSVLVPFILLSAVLLSLSASSVEAEPLASVATVSGSVGSVEAEPLAPAADISGQVVNPNGVPITETTWVCLMYLYPDGGDEDAACTAADLKHRAT